jgi:hypothetical protein
MTPEVLGSGFEAVLGFVAALGAAFCFGYAAGHHNVAAGTKKDPADGAKAGRTLRRVLRIRAR